jgi:hypothetical protein
MGSDDDDDDEEEGGDDGEDIDKAVVDAVFKSN